MPGLFLLRRHLPLQARPKRGRRSENARDFNRIDLRLEDLGTGLQRSTKYAETTLYLAQTCDTARGVRGGSPGFPRPAQCALLLASISPRLLVNLTSFITVSAPLCSANRTPRPGQGTGQAGHPICHFPGLLCEPLVWKALSPTPGA